MLAGEESDTEMAQPIQRARQALRQGVSINTARSYRSEGGTGSQDDSDVEAQVIGGRGRPRRMSSRKQSLEGHIGLLFSPGSVERDHEFAPRSLQVGHSVLRGRLCRHMRSFYKAKSCTMVSD